MYESSGYHRIGKRWKSENRPSSVLRSEALAADLESAPVPRSLEALRQTANAGLWTLRCDRCSDWLRTGTAIARALAVAPAQAKVLPLAERAMAAIAGAVPLALGVEACELVKTDLLGRVLRAVDATALSAVVTAVEEAKWRLAGCR